MHWFILAIASILEAVWALGMPATQGFTRLIPSLWVGGAMIGSFVLLAQASKTIPAATAYTVWVGLGIALTVLIEAFWLGKPSSGLRWVFVALLLFSVLGVQMTTRTS